MIDTNCRREDGSYPQHVGNGLRAVPQYRVPSFLTGSANTEIVDFDPLGAKIHGTARRPSPTNHP